MIVDGLIFLGKFGELYTVQNQHFLTPYDIDVFHFASLGADYHQVC